MPHNTPEKAKAYREANRERLSIAGKAWIKANYKRYAFAVQRADAKRRGIPFLFTFEEWWAIWEQSGRWAERGNRKDEYVMSRFGDKGPYAVGNVRICTCGQNTRERLDHHVVSPETKKLLSEILARVRRKGPHSEETRKRMSESAKAYRARIRSIQGPI